MNYRKPRNLSREDQETIDEAADARTLRGYIETYGETPAMTAANRDHWKQRAEIAEAARLLAEQQRDALQARIVELEKAVTLVVD